MYIERRFETAHLISVVGTKWYKRRKMLTPAFHFNLLTQFADILIEESERMVKCLKNTKGSVIENLMSFVNEHTLNIICGKLRYIFEK